MISMSIGWRVFNLGPALLLVLCCGLPSELDGGGVLLHLMKKKKPGVARLEVEQSVEYLGMMKTEWLTSSGKYS